MTIEKKFTHPNSDVFLNSAKQLCKQGKLEEAIKQLEEIIKEEMDNAYAYVECGKVYLQIAENENLLILEKSFFLFFREHNGIKVLINNINDCNFYGNTEFLHSIYKKSISILKKSIKINRNYAYAYVFLGKTYLLYSDHCEEYNKLKYKNKSLQNLNKAIEVDGNCADAYYWYAVFLYKNVGERFVYFTYDISLGGLVLNSEDISNLYDTNFFSYLSEAIKIDDKYDSAYRIRGLYYLDHESYEKSISDLKKAVELNPNDINNYYAIHDCYLSKYQNCELSQDEKDSLFECFDNFTEKNQYLKRYKIRYAMELAIKLKEYEKSREYRNKLFPHGTLLSSDERELLESFDRIIINAEELDKKNKELEETNKNLELALEKEKTLHKQLHEKEKEMLSFFTHTMRNALATAPESLRQAIRLLGSEDYESNQKHYKAINKIAALFSTLSLTDCLIDTFKQSISEPEEFQRAWQNDHEGEATPKWVIASALRQSLNRIIFMSDTSELRQLLNNADTPAIVAMRKSFIDNILPLNLDHQGIADFYQWLSDITTLEIAIENHDLHFGVNQVKFSLLFAISSELILNALKYWNGNGKIQIRWYTEQEQFIFKVTNACETNASSNLAGTHKGIAFIKRLMELLGEQAQFNCSVEEQLFIAELKLHQSLLEHNV